MDVSECVDCTLQSDGCRNAGPAVIAHPHILEKEAPQCCQCVPQWVEVVRWQPSFSHAVKVAEQSRPSSSVKHVFTFFPLCVYYVQPGNVPLFYISSLTGGQWIPPLCWWRLSFIQMTGAIFCLPGVWSKPCNSPWNAVSNLLRQNFPAGCKSGRLRFKQVFCLWKPVGNETFQIWPWLLSVLKCREVSKFKFRKGFK